MKFQLVVQELNIQTLNLKFGSMQRHLCSASMSTPTGVEADMVEYIMEPNTLTSLSSMSRQMLKCLQKLNYSTSIKIVLLPNVALVY